MQVVPAPTSALDHHHRGERCLFGHRQQGSYILQRHHLGGRDIDAKKATAIVSLSDLDQTYNGSPKFVTVHRAGGLTVMVTTMYVELPPTNAGSYAVWVSVLDDNYEGSATGTLVIAKGDQTIDFGGLADKRSATRHSV